MTPAPSPKSSPRRRLVCCLSPFTLSPVTWCAPCAEFRLDAFNIFNTPFFGFPNQNIGSPTAGQVTSTNTDMRDLQFSLKVTF